MASPISDSDILERLYSIIATRQGGDADVSYTAKLLAQGRGKIAQKVGEEAIETVIAAATGDRDAVVNESADLLYHLLVLWAESGVAPADVWGELARREGISGIAEKASRRPE